MQLSLFPVRGLAILLPNGELAVNLYSRLPAIYNTKRAAMRFMPSWLGGVVVSVSIHENTNDFNPTYVVEEAVKLHRKSKALLKDAENYLRDRR
jgi:hypothetical protein